MVPTSCSNQSNALGMAPATSISIAIRRRRQVTAVYLALTGDDETSSLTVDRS